MSGYQPWTGPTLHGPEAPRHLPGATGNRKIDRFLERGAHGPVTIYPRFDWKQVDGEWVEDLSAYVPMTYPEPLPDYAPGELERIEAAERKRARRAICA